MKKLLLQKYIYFWFSLIVVLSMASCIAPCNTRHQARTMRNISRPHHYRENPPSPRQRGDYNHPAVRKQTRKALKQRGN